MNLSLNILCTVSGRLTLMVLSLASSIVLARALGPEGRGLFALVLLLPELARGLGLLGFDQANAVYAGLDPNMRPALVWHSVVLAALVGGGFAAGCGVFLVLGAPGMPTLLQGPLWLYLLPLFVLPAALAAEHWQAILRGMNRIVLHNLIDVGSRTAGLLLLVVFLVAGRLDVANAVWANVVVAVLTAAVLVGVLWNVGAWKKPTFDLSVWRRSVHFAWPAYGGNVAGYLTYRINEFIIAVFLPPEQLAYYVLAVGIVERLWVLPGAAAVALLPHLTNSPTRDPVLSAVIARHVALWVGGASLLLFAFAHPAVELLYSSAFSPAVAPLRWLLPGIFLLSIGKVVLAEVIAREKPHFPSLASAVALIVNVAVNVALTPSMGISGAAVAASASYALLAVMWVWYYTKETRVPWTALLPSPKDFLLYTELLRRASVLGALGARSRE